VGHQSEVQPHSGVNHGVNHGHVMSQGMSGGMSGITPGGYDMWLQRALAWCQEQVVAAGAREAHRRWQKKMRKKKGLQEKGGRGRGVPSNDDPVDPLLKATVVSMLPGLDITPEAAEKALQQCGRDVDSAVAHLLCSSADVDGTLTQNLDGAADGVELGAEPSLQNTNMQTKPKSESDETQEKQTSDPAHQRRLAEAEQEEEQAIQSIQGAMQDGGGFCVAMDATLQEEGFAIYALRKELENNN